MIRISLIIATYNRAQPLIEALSSVARQSLDARLWECVVVNNNSKDDTQMRFEEFRTEHSGLNFRMVNESRQGLSYARNCGIAHAQGDIIAIIDDDERINPQFLGAYLNLFDTKSDAMSAGGRVIAQYDECPRPKWMSRYTEQPIANPMDWGDEIRPFPKGHIPAGGNMAFRREVFERFGMFNPNLGRVGDRLIGGEESDLFARLEREGCRCYYTPSAVMWHLIPSRKLERDYFDKLCYNIGVSQQVRARLSNSVLSLRIKELMKWLATLVIALGYLLSFRCSKARYLLIMRREITRGIYSEI